MMTKEFLLQAWKIDQRIERRIEERERLMARLTAGRSTNLSGMPRGGASDWTDAVHAVVVMDATIGAEIQKLCAIKRQVNDAISAVEDWRYRQLLELRYRNYMTWEDIAIEMGYDVRWIYRLHGEALLQVKIPKTPC